MSRTDAPSTLGPAYRWIDAPDGSYLQFHYGKLASIRWREKGSPPSM